MTLRRHQMPKRLTPPGAAVAVLVFLACATQCNSLLHASSKRYASTRHAALQGQGKPGDADVVAALREQLAKEKQRRRAAEKDVKQLESALAHDSPAPGPAPMPLAPAASAPGPSPSPTGRVDLPAAMNAAPAPAPVVAESAPAPAQAPSTTAAVPTASVAPVAAPAAAVASPPPAPPALPLIPYQPCPVAAPTAPPLAAAPATTSPAVPVPTGPAETPLVKKLRARGSPSCRQYPLRSCPKEFKSVAPSCISSISTASRSSTVASWFYLYLQKPGFILDLSTGCRGLRSIVPPGIEYVSSSELKQSCNFNDGKLPRLPDSIAEDMSGVIVATGVLEQVCDLPSFLEGLKSYYRPLIVSYAPVEDKDKRGRGQRRANQLTSSQWRTMLINLQLTRPAHQARVYIDGVPNLLYWFEPRDWTPFAG